MVKTFIVILVVLFQITSHAEANPNALSALEAFRDYQRLKMSGGSILRPLREISDALEINPLFYRTDESSHPILVLVAHSRRHLRPSGKPFMMVRDEVFRLLPSANFERRLYQLNDLQPGQARQSIWQLLDNDVGMRIEVVPGTSITITFFSAGDFQAAQHFSRLALMPGPRSQGRSF